MKKILATLLVSLFISSIIVAAETKTCAPAKMNEMKSTCNTAVKPHKKAGKMKKFILKEEKKVEAVVTKDIKAIETKLPKKSR